MEGVDVLIVEDEDHLRDGLALNFELEGCAVTPVATLQAARAAVAEGLPDLIVLDVMLPDGSGLDLCRQLREESIYVPILVLTAAGRPGDVVDGLESGADDYLTKPFNLSELLARARGLIRRQGWGRPEPSNRSRQVGEADLDWEAHEYVRDGEVHRLTGLELRLLGHFVDNVGRTLSREELLREVWGLKGYQTRTVDNFVARLRKYFEVDPSHPQLFLTIRGAGYRFETADQASPDDVSAVDPEGEES